MIQTNDLSSAGGTEPGGGQRRVLGRRPMGRSSGATNVGSSPDNTAGDEKPDVIAADETRSLPSERSGPQIHEGLEEPKDAKLPAVVASSPATAPVAAIAATTSAAAVTGAEPASAASEAAERSRQDLALLRRAAAGDGRAFQDLVDRHGRAMLRLAYLMTGSNADAEDIVQETWTGVFKSLKRFEGRSTVKTWLTRILTTQVALWRRKRKGGTVFLEDSPAAETDALPRKEAAADRHSDWQSDLSVALHKLTGDHREVIVLREIEQLSYDEIAEALSVPRGTVESRLHRARGELRKHLQAYLE